MILPQFAFTFDKEIVEIRIVKPAQGWAWAKEAWHTFWKKPLLWLAFSAITLLALAGMASIPVAGKPLADLMLPVMLAGFLSGCRALRQGGQLSISHLFAGFHQHAQHLVALGGIYFAGQLLIAGAMQLAGGEKLVSMLVEGVQPEQQEALAQAISESGLSIVIGAALFFVLAMAMQFAPALVIFGNAKPLSALKTSLQACLGNLLALSVYAAIMLASIMAIVALLQGSVLFVVAMLALLPFAMAATYSAYCDIFPGQG